MWMEAPPQPTWRNGKFKNFLDNYMVKPYHGDKGLKHG
jgi:hypothetical protein